MTGCQTAAPLDPATIPAVLHPLFTPCAPTDGALSVQAFKDDALLGSLEVEWIAAPSGDWDLEAVNAMGNTMLTLSRKGREITSSGRLATKLPKLSVSKGGYLEIDEASVGIKASEMPCMLAFRLPRTWMMQVRSVEHDAKTAAIRVEDSMREIDITAEGVENGKPSSVCTRISWTRYLVFHPELIWCQKTVGERVEATLSGIEGQSLRWVSLDEN